MSSDTYLNWVISNTRTVLWHDSADPEELRQGLDRGATGVTTNPFLTSVALLQNRDQWAPEANLVLRRNLAAEPKAEALTHTVLAPAATMYRAIYERSNGKAGYVCAQLNPSRAGEREATMAMARRFREWAPNIAVKLPAVAAGLDVMEDCIAEGISAAATISFTVPQVVAVAERCRAGRLRAARKGIKPGECYAVIMIGRLDDYLREVARDNQSPVGESDIRQAGLAVTKRAYRIYQERRYEAVLLLAALRGSYHVTELTGAGLIISMTTAAQEWFLAEDYPREERIEKEIAQDVIERLSTMPEFVKAYEPDGMNPAEFISYGATQRTLSQYIESGWKRLENYH
jgi:transaldolase